jgi:ribonuclease-3
MGASRDAALSELQDRLGHRFRNGALLCEALRHASRAGASYERLEFLGDRVLGLHVAELLYRRFPNESEGDLARRHAELVRRETVVRVAQHLALGSYLDMAEGDDAAGTRDSPTVLADCCEAVIGALYLDGGPAASASFVERAWEPLIRAVPVPPKDAKTALQEWSQAAAKGLPVYRLVARTGPDHAPSFIVQVEVGGLEEKGEGGSKQAAEMDAAARLLARLDIQGR